MSDTSKTRLISPLAILSYPHLFKAMPGPNGGEPKFSACLVFPDGTDLSPLKRAVAIVGSEKWGDKFAEMVRNSSLRMPFRHDITGKGYPEGSIFLNANSKQQPGIVGAQLQEIAPDDIYAGAFVKASITAFAYDEAGKGVAFALNNVQFIRDGERLDNRVAPEDEFEKEMNDEAASADDSSVNDIADYL